MTDTSNEDIKPEPEDSFGTVERTTNNFEFAAPVKQTSMPKDPNAWTKITASDRLWAKFTVAGLIVNLIAVGIISFGVLCLGLFAA